jgi:hypothetical protein
VVVSRWPDLVREPLPVGLITSQDIQDAINLAGCHLLDPEDPAFDPTTFGALCAARAALIECADVLDLARIDRELHGSDVIHTAERFGREYVAQKVARRVINELRQWLPEVTYG